jgi:hypothetical protein
MDMFDVWLALQSIGFTVGHKFKALAGLATGVPVLAGVTKCPRADVHRALRKPLARGNDGAWLP